jgi:hypothetical protein
MDDKEKEKYPVIIMIPKRQFWAEFTVKGLFAFYQDDANCENCYKIIGHSNMGDVQFVCLTPWEDTMVGGSVA